MVTYFAPSTQHPAPSTFHPPKLSLTFVASAKKVAKEGSTQQHENPPYIMLNIKKVLSLQPIFNQNNV